MIETIKTLVIAIVGIFIICRVIVDSWSSVMPGRIGAKSGTEAQKAREQHPVAYWVGRILMMTIGAWIVTFAILGSWNWNDGQSWHKAAQASKQACPQLAESGNATVKGELGFWPMLLKKSQIAGC
jgi:hypothetical protein